ncbi:MAG TPA: N-6 DNA methylase [Terriglobia bacterium]|nr:N-6 DNA methylase [Terriglobia bacterium]
MPEINEWTFAADVCKTIQGIVADNPSLPFSEAKVEQGTGQGRKRRDVTLYDNQNRAVLTGEIKLPDRPDGQTPYANALLEDAHGKADARGVTYFFTWNVNRFVLWKTFEAGKPIAERDLEHFNVTSITRSEELLDSEVQTEIRGFLTQFLGRYARIIAGAEPIRSKPLDEKFIKMLESALELPILQTRNAVTARYGKEKQFARDLDTWMRDAQGWLISNDPKIMRDNLERVAKFSCYVLVNKIVFQQALRRRFPSLRKIRISESAKTAGELQRVLLAAFDEAKRISHDYETVFDGDFGDTLPFMDDGLVLSWRELVREVEGFDFGKIEYEIIGHIFERLISPEERHRYGQHYTRSEIVDLINTFTIRDAAATVLDPACGGGTFLVRAYALKRALSGGSIPHVDLLQQIKGIDQSAYAAHLSTINLATRDLIDARNYPLVARSDFFKVKPGEAIFHVPMSVHGKGKQMVPLELGEVDAVVGNPPYVRQEELPKPYKEMLTKVIEHEFPDCDLSGRSDLHCYFWPHATSFLKEEGYYGFLTSSSWLDTEYGFHLQEWLLRHFAVLALFESNCEPWFTGARVTTVATLMRRESDPGRRATNTIRFVQLKKPLKEILESFDSDPLNAARMMRDFVENQTQNLLDDRWRIRVLNQHELWTAGCTGGIAGVAAALDRQESTGLGSQSFQGNYVGGKWGIYLRAPDIFFTLLDLCGPRLVPLGQIAEIRRGVTSGVDDFFFVRDVTELEIQKCNEGLPPDSPSIARRFKNKWGIRIADTKKVRIVESGDHSRHLIEVEYLEPEVHSLMEIDSVEIDPATLSKKILLVSDPPEKLKGTHVLKYVRWGEREGFDQGTTCASRAKSRPWYDLNPGKAGEMAWPMAQKYRHIVALNSSRTLLNHNLFDIFSTEGKPHLLAGILNSSFVALSKIQFGRSNLGEATLKTEVIDVKSMTVPDVRQTPKEAEARILKAFDTLKKRPSLHLVEELSLSDRNEIDDAVLESMGLTEKSERDRLRSEMYAELARFYREGRQLDLKAQANRRITARRDHASPRTIAEEIWAEFDKAQIRKFPADFIPDAELTETVSLPEGKPKVLHDLFHRGAIQINGTVIKLGSKERAEFAAETAERGNSGPNPIPKNDRDCERALAALRDYETQMESTFRELAEERSADTEMQTRIVRELWKLLHAHGRHSAIGS